VVTALPYEEGVRVPDNTTYSTTESTTDSTADTTRSTGHGATQHTSQEPRYGVTGDLRPSGRQVAQADGSAGEPTRVGPDNVTLVAGSSFCVSGPGGDLDRGSPQGLFVHDTRILSTWRLAVDGAPPELLTSATLEPYHAVFYMRAHAQLPDAMPDRPVYLVLRRDRYVGTGMREDIEIRNERRSPVRCTLQIAVGADFADLFEVKEERVRSTEVAVADVLPDGIRLDRKWETGRRGVVVTAEGADGRTEGLHFDVEVPARGVWRTSIEVLATVDGAALPGGFEAETPVEQALPARRLSEWRSVSPRIVSRDQALERTLARSTTDLGALRIFDPENPDTPAIAAGAPWFMALFGRDSLLSSYLALPLDPTLPLGTLRTLARLQGEKEDLRTEEQPGRILHEVRLGANTELALGDGRIYYGSVDATPLFVILVGELRKWGMSDDVVESLLPHVDRALTWIREYGDLDGDGFVEYERKSSRGLVNQGWKDSWDGVTFADGTLAKPPIALAEVQGYVYAAYVARAHFAREACDEELAHTWARRASRLKKDFNEAFWMPDRGWYAMGLDRDKRPIDSLASNMGHCLWSGIVDKEKAPLVARALMSPEMFTGWGVRTLAKSMGAYDPISYHNGSVWPHDSAIVTSGLMRYGLVEEARRLAFAVLEAASSFGGRLPELMCGFDRSEFPRPIPYPTSCSPQAWAAATPIHLLRLLLRFEPWVPQRKLWIAPVLPSWLETISVQNLHFGGSEVRITATQTEARLSGLPPEFEVIHDARPPLTAWVEGEVDG
jgi:glycogen debranching enzyme